ncbi:hypothetical protein [Beijerinckia sp. L45]|uniref:hypothetical protein n=1 Tax=Beijerinckia sp. L45 TaxID=1641855 RepID=UPI00131D8C7D|nr:hypothetical protein [Beijerinckia sp. L45]
MSAMSNCAVDKAYLASSGATTRGALAAVAVAVLAAATYAVPARLWPIHAKASASAQDARSTLDPAIAHSGVAPQPWHEPEVAPRPTLVGSAAHVTASLTRARSRGSARDGAMPQAVSQIASGGRFDTKSIAAFLRTASASPPKPAKVAPSNMIPTFAVAALEADGIADDASAPVTQVSSATSPARPKDAPGDSSLAFPTALGQVKTAAHAGVMNGQPAAALNIGLTTGPIVIDATGMSEVTNLSEPGVFRKTFKLSTRASIPLD